MKPIYVAAPMAGATPLEVAWNMARAGLLARLALAQGLPVVPGPLVPAVVSVADPPGPELLDLWRVELVELVAARPDGCLWILEPQVGKLAPENVAELAAWARLRGSSRDRVLRLAWEGWRAGAVAWRLGDAWDRLAGRPEDLARAAGLGDELASLGRPPE